MKQDRLMFLHAPEKKGIVAEYLQRHLFELTPDARRLGIVAQYHRLFARYFQTGRRSLRAYIEWRIACEGSGLRADKGHAWRQKRVGKDRHHRLWVRARRRVFVVGLKCWDWLVSCH